MATFQDFKLQEYCNQVIKELGFKKPTPIQEKVIPLVLKNRDIIGISQTGTGKSHAFLLPTCLVLMPIKIVCKLLLQHQQENLLLNYLITLKHLQNIYQNYVFH